MTYLTEREKEIVILLKQGMIVNDIGKKLETPTTSISRSITSIRRKAQDIQEDVAFLKEVGFLNIEGGELFFISPNRDPKALSKIKH
jgi:transcriptional regulator